MAHSKGMTMIMARKARKLLEMQELFEEHEIDFTMFDDEEVVKQLMERISSVNDIRHESYIRHKLIDIIMITLFAVLSNANEWAEIEEFGKAKEQWLRKFLELPFGIPSDDTIRIAISNLDSRYFYSLVIEFLMEKVNEILNSFNSLEKPIDTESVENKEILSVDGKTSCGSKRNDTDIKGAKALHTLNVYSSNYGMCTGQVFVDEKTNEIPAMIDLLKIIDVKDSVLTWDALNTQKETVAAVIKNKGDYVGALKGNQHNFYKDVKLYFDEEVIRELRKNPLRYMKTKEKEHSAIIEREYFLTDDIKWLYNMDKWAGLKAIGLERKTITKKNGEVAIEERYFICSIVNIELFARAVREHWGVENGLHWHLDYTFKDDKNTTMDKNGARNLQLIKKIALSLLKAVQTLYKVSLKRIRYKLSLNFENEIERVFKMLNTNDLRTYFAK
jgi:predicted transposase YbfD/YdcC